MCFQYILQIYINYFNFLPFVALSGLIACRIYLHIVLYPTSVLSITKVSANVASCSLNALCRMVNPVAAPLTRCTARATAAH